MKMCTWAQPRSSLMSGLTLSKCYHLANEILSINCCLLQDVNLLSLFVNLLSLFLRFFLRFFCMGFQPRAFAEVLQILPSQPPIELIALASAVKQTLERQSAEVPHYKGMCLISTTLGKKSLCKSFPAPLLVLVLSKWLPYHPSKTMIYQFVFIYMVHYAVYYKKMERHLLPLSWHYHWNP